MFIAFRLLTVLVLLPFVLTWPLDFTEVKRTSASGLNNLKIRRNSEQEEHFVPKPGVRLLGTPGSSLFVEPYESITLECEAEGNSSPTIYWLKDGRRINQGAEDGVESIDNMRVREGFSRTRSRLYLDCVSAKDEGLYSCASESPHQRASEKTGLKLTESDRASGATCRLGTPARIYMWTRARIEVQGNDIQLFCRSSGNPRPQVVWMRENKDGERIQNSQKYKVLENGDLVIRNLSWGDLGGYTCMAQNIHGNAKTFTFVYPAAPESDSK
ncbi:zwei Ig domain protein zig-4-like isoform X2 [Tachypleus tridentatus]|uniref:zwei Ig domain protein zig-4-like isoform X2 n=1 Tax=Tachypleus tridentatus TaxID=6853 RepID=UPI003FCFC538